MDVCISFQEKNGLTVEILMLSSLWDMVRFFFHILKLLFSRTCFVKAMLCVKQSVCIVNIILLTKTDNQSTLEGFYVQSVFFIGCSH